MIELLSRLFTSTIGAIVDREVRRLVRSIICGVAAAIFLVGAVIFLILAGFFWLDLHYPPVEAALLMAVALLVLAIACALPLVLARRRRPKQATIAEEVAPLVDILKAAGCQSEAASLLAGAQLAAQVRPYYLVATAVVIGLILGRKLGPRAPSEKSGPP